MANLEEILQQLKQGGGSADGSTFTPGSSQNTVMAGLYESTPSTLDNNETGAIGLDTNRNVKVREQYAPVYEDNTAGVAKVERRYTNAFVTLASLTIIKASAGFVNRITVGHSSNPTLTLYDNASGAGSVLHIFGAGVPAGSYVLDHEFANGLVAIFMPGNAPSLSVGYR